MEAREGTGTSVAVEGVAKAYGDAAALHGVSLDVRPGELLALLGPSGSGKTTLLRVIAGLEIPDRGRVLFGGEDATATPVQRRGVGFVFQHYALFRHMRVADNVAYGLRSRPRATRPAEAEIGRRVADLLALVQLESLGQRFPAQLSGGQRQRVALARALAVEPRVLLLDEPFGALDAQVRKDLRRWLRHIHERTGRTTVFVTHDQEEALELADRVAILDRGRLEQVGTPDEVYDRPASRFVTGFLGIAVALPGRAVAGRVEIEGRTIPVAAPAGVEGPVEVLARVSDIAVVAPDEGHLRTEVRFARRSAPGRRMLEVEVGGRVVEVPVAADSDARAGAVIGLRLDRVEVAAL
jgi:sulfate/thiosulfate transport system ATP-binding protein